MLDININAKNHPDWLDAGCDEDARQTWIDETCLNMLTDYANVNDALAELDEEELAYIGSRVYDNNTDAMVLIGKLIAKKVFEYSNDVAERQWEMINE